MLYRCGHFLDVTDAADASVRFDGHIMRHWNHRWSWSHPHWRWGRSVAPRRMDMRSNRVTYRWCNWRRLPKGISITTGDWRWVSDSSSTPIWRTDRRWLPHASWIWSPSVIVIWIPPCNVRARCPFDSIADGSVNAASSSHCTNGRWGGGWRGRSVLTRGCGVHLIAETESQCTTQGTLLQHRRLEPQDNVRKEALKRYIFQKPNVCISNRRFV